MQPEQKPKSMAQKRAEMFDMTAILARSLAMWAEPWLNSAPGVDRYGTYALVAFVAMILLAGQYRDIVVYRYMWLWVAAVLYRRIEVFIRARKGVRVHSQSPGAEWLADRLGLQRLGRFANPMLCLVIGGSCMLLSEVLGKMWLAAGVAMVFLDGVHVLLRNTRRQAAFDQREEMEWIRREG